MNEFTQIQSRLLSMQDTAYREFHKSLIPTLQAELIGVRVPQVRKLARELSRSAEKDAFLKTLPHRFYEENLLHAILLSGEKELDAALSSVDAFLPYVDNWAVCDAFSPKVFARHPQAVLAQIPRWLSSGETYTIRFGTNTLMSFFLGEHFAPAQLRMVGKIQSSEYYVNMGRAWYFATALSKQETQTLSYLLENELDVWTHNKTIQKACESYRISPELKALLRTKKR